MKNKIIGFSLIPVLLLIGGFISIPRILPSFSSVWNALNSLFLNYDLLFHSFYSITTVLSNIMISNLLLAYLLPSFIGSKLEKKDLGPFPIGIVSVAVFFIGIYIIMVFPLQHFALSLTLFPISFVLTYNHLVPQFNKLRGESIEYYSSLKKDDASLMSTLAGSLMRSKIYSNIHETLNVLWMWLLVFEFISEYERGLGSLVRMGYEYWSLPLMFAAAGYTALFIWLANLCLDGVLYLINLKRLKV